MNYWRKTCFTLLFSLLLLLEVERIKSECDIEALRCDVICFFPELSQHCNTCGVRRPMRFGKRDYRQVPQNLFVVSEQKNEKFSKISDEGPEFLEFSGDGSNTEGSKSLFMGSPKINKESGAFNNQIPEFLLFPNEFSNTEGSKSLLMGLRVSRSPEYSGNQYPDDVTGESRREWPVLNSDKKLRTRILKGNAFIPISNLNDIFPRFINKKFFNQRSNTINFIKHFQKSPQRLQKPSLFYSKFQKLREIKRNLSVLTSKELNTKEMISGIKNIMDMESLPLDPVNYGCHLMF